MDAVILAAGLGTRLMPITAHTPKPLVSINGETMLSRHINLLNYISSQKIAVNNYCEHYQIEQHLDRIRQQMNADRKIILSTEEKLLGTGGGIKRCLIEADIYDDFLLVSADVYTTLNLSAFVRFHREKMSKDVGLLFVVPSHQKIYPKSRKIDAYLSTTSLPNTNSSAQDADLKNVYQLCSSPQSKSSSGNKTSEQATAIQYAGIAVLPAHWFTKKSEDEFRFWQDCLEPYLNEGKLFGYSSSALHIDIGTHANLADARAKDLRLSHQYSKNAGSAATIMSWENSTLLD